MQDNTYQLLALGARALFLLLAALLVFRAALYLLRQHHARKKLLRLLPDAGMVGEMRDIESDQGYPLPREGVLGGSRGCDIRLKGLRRRQVNFAYVEGKGILLTPCHRRSNTLLDGEPLGRGAYALHGALLQAGGYTLRIRLFAGLNVPEPAQFQEHWQPAYEEDLYAPDETQLSAFSGWEEWAQMQWPEDPAEEAPVFGSMPAQPEAAPPEPPQAPQEEAPGPRRHRRSDRRRTL